MVTTTAKYEVVMIFNVNQGEDGIAALSDRFKKMMEDNGTIDNVEVWGKRKLAYPIEDELEGFYTLCSITCGHDFPAELDRVFKITDGVLRSMIIRVEEESAKPAKAAKPGAATAAAEPAAEAEAATTEGE
jgi:small subunit ribosomal protein S6